MAVRDDRAAELRGGDFTALGVAGALFLSAFLLSAGRVSGSLAPFGIAAVAASPSGMSGAGALAGAVLGYLVTGEMDWGIRYAAASVTLYTLLFILQDSRALRRDWARPALALLVTAAAGLLNCAAGGLYILDELPGVAAESALAAGGAYFFREASSPSRSRTELGEKRHAAAAAITAACALMSLARVELFGAVGLGRVLALLLVLTAGFKGGAFAGSAAGAAFGLAMDAAGETGGFYTAAWAFGALCGGGFARFGRLTFLSAFVLTAALAALGVGGGEALPALFEAFAASVIFMLLPSGLLARLGSLVRPLSPGVGESGLRRYASRRAENIAQACLDVRDAARRGTECVNDNDVARVFDRAAAAACADCARRDGCWGADYMETLDALGGAVGVMTERGRLEEGDVAEWFRDKCVNLKAFVAAVNGELRAQLTRREYAARLREGRAAAWEQYEDFANILAQLSRELANANGADPLSERRLLRYLHSLDIEADAAVFRDASGRLRAVIESANLSALTRDPAWLDRLSAVLGVRLCTPATEAKGRITLLEAEPLMASVGVAAMRKSGESVSGDRGTYFKTDAGVLCVILSDGMGTGEEAAKESERAVGILERFLRSGVEPGTAMRILSSVMLLSSGGEWGFATADLLCVDLFGGEAGFYKYGAAPSYVRSGGAVRRIDCSALAAGISDGCGQRPDELHLMLKPGSVALIVSDGVVSGGDEWLRSLLAASEGADMKALARETLRRAASEYGCSDDMTVLAVRVDARP